MIIHLAWRVTMSTARKWTSDELLVALNLYRKLSFGQLHARNPVIIELAAKMDRSAATKRRACSHRGGLHAASPRPAGEGQGEGENVEGLAVCERHGWFQPFSRTSFLSRWERRSVTPRQAISNAARRFPAPSPRARFQLYRV
jgi:hypothetical protein